MIEEILNESILEKFFNISIIVRSLPALPCFTVRTVNGVQPEP